MKQEIDLTPWVVSVETISKQLQYSCENRESILKEAAEKVAAINERNAEQAIIHAQFQEIESLPGKICIELLRKTESAKQIHDLVGLIDAAYYSKHIKLKENDWLGMIDAIKEKKRIFEGMKKARESLPAYNWEPDDVNVLHFVNLPAVINQTHRMTLEMVAEDYERRATKQEAMNPDDPYSGMFNAETAEDLKSLLRAVQPPPWIYGYWKTVPQFQSEPNEGWCWISYKGKVVEAYHDHEGLFRFCKHSRSVYMTECITAVLAWPVPDAPKRWGEDE